MKIKMLITSVLFFLSSNLFAANGNDFSAFDFGIGIGVEQYDDKYVERASINGTNRTVIVEEELRTRPSVWLVSNWTIDKEWFKGVRPGFYVGAKMLDEKGDSLSGFSLGFQLVFSRVQQSDGEKKKSINVGIGWVTHKVQRLADGIKENQPLPADFDEIKYKSKQESSYMLMVSTNFM